MAVLAIVVLVVVVSASVAWRAAVTVWDVDSPQDAVAVARGRLYPGRAVSLGTLQRRILRTAVGSRVVSVRGTSLVPSTFEVALHPDDHEALAGVRTWIAGELAAALVDRAEAEGWELEGRPVVTFVPDDRRPPGRPAVRARHESATVHLPADAARVPLAATGAPAPLAVAWLRPLGNEDPVPLTGTQPVVLGRGSTASVALAVAAVSRRHCELRPSAEGWEVVDLGSINGTEVNGRPVTAPTLLHPGDELCLTEAVRFVAEAVHPPARHAHGDVPLPATVAAPVEVG